MNSEIQNLDREGKEFSQEQLKQLYSLNLIEVNHPMIEWIESSISHAYIMGYMRGEKFAYRRLRDNFKKKQI